VLKCKSIFVRGVRSQESGVRRKKEEEGEGRKKEEIKLPNDN
jgi:hypothetical protein